MTDLRHLIVNADDLGLAEGVNRGILEAHEAGVVTSASLLANGASFGHAVSLVRGAPALGIGVHLDFVAGRPLTTARSLVDARTGHFYSLPVLACRASLGRVDRDDVIAESGAQIERVRNAGIAVTHVDSHRHAHLLPGVWSGVVVAITAANIGRLRMPVERLSWMADSCALRPAIKIIALRTAATVATRGRPIPMHADQFAGIALQGCRRFAARLLRLLDCLPSGTTELMVHPGHVDPALASLDSYVRPRENELDTLLSAAVRDRLHRGDIRLVNFNALARA